MESGSALAWASGLAAGRLAARPEGPRGAGRRGRGAVTSARRRSPGARTSGRGRSTFTGSPGAGRTGWRCGPGSCGRRSRRPRCRFPPECTRPGSRAGRRFGLAAQATASALGEARGLRPGIGTLASSSPRTTGWMDKGLIVVLSGRIGPKTEHDGVCGGKTRPKRNTVTASTTSARWSARGPWPRWRLGPVGGRPGGR